MLNKDCIEKILNVGRGDSVSVGRGFLDLFKAMVEEAEFKRIPSLTMNFLMYDENTNLQPGEYAAELHFVVRKADDSNADSTDEVDQETESESKE